MNKNSQSKLNFYMQMLRGRYGDGAYFLAMEITFRSGTKQFPASVTKSGDALVLKHGGAETPFSWDMMGEVARPYDAIHLIYRERGTNAVIRGDDRGVTMTYEDSAAAPQSETATVAARAYCIAPPKANALLREIGIMTADGKIKNDKVRKYNQIDHFVELTSDYLKRLPDGVEVLDCACGKSYLSFALNYYLKDVLKKNCHVTGVDYSPVVIEASKRAAERLGYENMTFLEADLTVFRPTRRPNVVISLHACDTATDMAIAAGINAKAEAIFAVPCCHKELLEQYELAPLAPILKHGVFRAREADLLTDGLRALLLEACGYSVTVQEYISPVETPKNLLIRAFRDGKRAAEARAEYQALRDLLGVRPTLERLIFHD